MKKILLLFVNFCFIFTSFILLHVRTQCEVDVVEVLVLVVVDVDAFVAVK